MLVSSKERLRNKLLLFCMMVSSNQVTFLLRTSSTCEKEGWYLASVCRLQVAQQNSSPWQIPHPKHRWTHIWYMAQPMFPKIDLCLTYVIFWWYSLMMFKFTVLHQVFTSNTYKIVLQLLLHNQFYTKALKCYFGETPSSFLGHVVSADCGE